MYIERFSSIFCCRVKKKNSKKIKYEMILIITYLRYLKAIFVDLWRYFQYGANYPGENRGKHDTETSQTFFLSNKLKT